MYKTKLLLVLFLTYHCHVCFCKTTGEPVFTKKETLFSTKSGNPIGEVLLSIAAKSDDAKNNEWYLTIGDKSDNFFEADNKSIWIFNKKINANSFKKDLNNRDYPLEVKGFSEFMAFSENEIRFDLRDWEELRKQTRISFYLNAKKGDKISLRLVFYSSSKDKKKTTINDEAKVKIDFVIPDPAEVVAAKKVEAVKDDELISLTEKIDYDAIAKSKAEQASADSLKQAQEAERSQRAGLVNSFITERNNEVNSLQEVVDSLLADGKNKVDIRTIDSLETINEELKKKVEYWEKGYTDILLSDVSIHDKFSKFGTTVGFTSKKLVELRDQQDSTKKLMNFAKKNWILIAVLGIVSIILVKLLKKLMTKVTQTIKNKIKEKKQVVKIKHSLKEMEEKKRKEEFEKADINELYEI